LPVPAGKHDGAAHQLVGFLGIDAEVHGDVDGFVELGGGAFLDQAQRLGNGIGLVAVDLGTQRRGALGKFGHVTCPPR
jgi:hypothetical protein